MDHTAYRTAITTMFAASFDAGNVPLGKVMKFEGAGGISIAR